MQQLIKKLRFSVIVEVDEDGYYIVSCPPLQRLSHLR